MRKGRTRGINRILSVILPLVLIVLALFAPVSGLRLHAEGEYSMEYSILQPEDLAWIAEAREALREIVRERDVMALIYLTDAYAIREQAGTDSAVAATVYSGQTVNILDVEIAEEDEELVSWAKVSFYDKGKERQGYVERSYLACSDERFLNWESKYGMNPAGGAVYALEGQTSVNTADIEQFPAGYRAALTELKRQHPLWTFVPLHTNLDWQTAINNELTGGKSLVYKTFAACTKEGAYDDGYWYYASEDILKYYMDPRNALTEGAIFQFELLTYNETYHTEAAVKSFLDNTFMNSNKNAPGTDMTFAHIFWAIGAEECRQVSPFHLAARVYQEQGQGTSQLISGTYAGQGGTLKGYYNYFNVGATGQSTEAVIISGLTYAKEHGWTDAYYSILGGADVISANYIKKGQDTLYLQKYNVNPNSANAVYTHQYMQNISAPATEASKIRELYNKAGSLDNTFVFKIPVYNNMPDSACQKPTASTNVALQVPSGYDATVWIDGVAYPSVKRNGRNIVTVGNNAAKSAVVYSYNASGVPTGMYVWTLDYQDGAYQETAQPQLTDLLTYHGCSIRITGKSGIRFKTGISATLKSQLAKSGVNGYYLKEYGTLVMNNANRGAYPMVKGGEKVLVGMAYGTNANGRREDNIYETVGGRQRFTSVLVGLPASQYKVEYAFRGYLTLEKNGKETIVYGPVVARSIYALAEQVLDAGTYAEGSAASDFLKQIIIDATP